MTTSAIVGLGSIGNRHLKGLTTYANEFGIDKILITDLSSSRLATAISNSPIAQESSIENIKDNADSVFICTPTFHHLSALKDFYSSSVSRIYLEKPLSSEIDGWRKVVEEDIRQKNNTIVRVGYMLRFHPVIQKIKTLLNPDFVGRVLHVRVASGFYLPYWHPDEDYRAFYMSSRAQGGGVLLDTSHEIDYLTWLFGSIDTFSASVKRISNLDILADDLTRISGTLVNGTCFDIHLDLLQFEEERTCKIICENAVITASLTTGDLCISHKDSSLSDKLSFNIDFNEIYHKSYKEFFTSDQSSTQASLTDSYHVLEVIEGARHSSAYSTMCKLPLWTK